MNLYMLLVGCKPQGRHSEQHDVFFGIATSPSELLPQLQQFWPDGYSSMHIDAYREVKHVNGYEIKIVAKQTTTANPAQLFFINLGGYKPGDFEEYHYKLIAAAENKTAAIQAAKQTAFYKHCGYKGAESHIDDKYGIDIDDFYAIEDILAPALLQQYSIVLLAATTDVEDELHIGYLTLKKMAALVQ